VTHAPSIPAAACVPDPAPVAANGAVTGLAARVGVAGVLRALQGLLAFAAAVAAARLLGPTAYGAYAVALSVLGLAAPVIALGLPLVALRSVAAQRAGELPALARFGPAAILAVGGAAAGATWLAADSLTAPWRFGLPAELAALAVAAAVPCALLRWWSGWTLGAGRTARGQLGEALLRPLALLAGLGLLAALGGAVTAGQAIALQALALALAALPAAVWARQVRRSAAGAHPAAAARPRAWLGAGLPLMAAGLLGLLQLNLDLLMLGALAGVEAAGPYHAAARLAQLAALPLVAANLVLAGALAAAHAAGERARLQALLTRWARICSAAAAGVLVLALPAGGAALQLFGPGFAGAHAALVVLAAGQLVNVACGSVALVLSVTGHERAVLAGMVLGAAANLALNALLIPVWGITGAALATALSTVAWNLALARSVRRRLGVEPSLLGRTPC
jgi:O-antigen/teichoic acid export membrane protein